MSKLEKFLDQLKAAAKSSSSHVKIGETRTSVAAVNSIIEEIEVAHRICTANINEPDMPAGEKQHHKRLFQSILMKRLIILGFKRQQARKYMIGYISGV